MPEIPVHKAGPTSGLSHFGRSDPDFAPPYWAHWWGGGLALARHVLDNPDIVTGKRVLDLGAGSGLVAIAAARAGGSHVLAADIDRYAIAAIALNAQANGVTVHTHHGDLANAECLPDVDLILVGDLFYEADLATRITAFLDRCLDAGIQSLVGDPYRTHLPLARLRRLADYPGADFGTGPDIQARNAVFAFTRQA